jgi:hypothetical protein
MKQAAVKKDAADDLLEPDRAAAPVAHTAGAGPLRSVLQILVYEADETARKELLAEGVRGEPGVWLARARLAEIRNKVNELAPHIAELSDADRHSLAPLAQALYGKAWLLAFERPAVEQFLQPFAEDLAHIFGAVDLSHPEGLGFQATQPEAEDGVRHELTAARAELEGALEQHRADFQGKQQKSADLLGTPALSRLAGAKAFLRQLDPTVAHGMQPQVRELAQLAGQLQDYIAEQGGPHLRDLLIRVSDVLEGVGIHVRLTPKTMAEAVKEDLYGKPADAADVADFHAAAASWGVVFDTLFEKQMAAVTTIESEVTEKDPEKKLPFWADLVVNLCFTALAMVTGGLSNLILGKKVTEAVAGEFEEKVAEGVKEVMTSVAESSIDTIKEHVKEPGESGGDAESSYLKTEYFSGQRNALIYTHKQNKLRVVEVVRKFEKQLGKEPHAKIHAVETMVAEAGAKGERAGEIQARTTRSKYATLLAHASLAREGDDPAAQTQVQRSLRMRDVLVDNPAGLITLEAQPRSERTDPVVVVEAWASGLNEGMCDALSRVSLVEEGIPFRVSLTVSRYRPLAAMARSETGGIAFHEQYEDAGRNLLAQHAGVDGEHVNVIEVARKILEDEVGNRPVHQHPAGKIKKVD